ncbi:MAG: hypothetical protein Q8S44_08470 [Flavobacteriaceae bacterium]|nr:hypothetical protein [Flavobacteriaceae bacterium]
MNLKIPFISFLLIGCSVLPLEYYQFISVDSSWKNPKYVHFKPSKILVLTICNDIINRKSIEDCFNSEFKERGLTSYSCSKKYNNQFLISKKSEKELKRFDEKLMEDGFDAIFVTSIKGVEKQLDYKKDYYKIYHEWYRFNNYFNYNQDAIIFPNYYSDFKYYNFESSLYTINCKSDKTFVWAGVIKIINPLKLNETMYQHSKSIIKELEHHQIIPKKST